MKETTLNKPENNPGLGFHHVTIRFLWILLFLWASPAKSQVLEYFPLQLGNVWTYDDVVDAHNVGQDTVTIIDTVYNDSKNYFVFNKFFYAREFKDSSLFYIDGEKVFRKVDGIEQLWFDFGAPVDTSWLIDVYDSDLQADVQVRITLTGKTFNRFINGRNFSNCYSFNFDNLNATDLDWTYTFAPGIGCIEKGIGTLVPAYYRFRDGIVNGIDYPDLITKVSYEGTPQKVSIDNPRILSVHPNPFNSSAIVDIFVKNPNDEKIDICIYNTMGELIKMFPSEQFINGNYMLNWHAKNQVGVPVSSGIYFVILSVGNKLVSAQKVIYTK